MTEETPDLQQARDDIQRASRTWNPVEVTITPPPDLQQAIHAATDALQGRASVRLSTYSEFAHIAVEAAWPRSALAELAVLRHSNSQMRDLTRQQDTALTETRKQLQAAQAENQQLRDFIRSIEWYGTRCNIDITGCEDEDVCPVCDSSPDEGHQANCRLAAALNQQAAPGQDDDE